MQRKRKLSLSKQVENSANEAVEKSNIELNTKLLIPSGSTLLNCACSGSPFGAFAANSMNTIPRSSQGGKSILMLTMLAECCYDKRFDDYNIIYDDTEFANHFNMAHLFGKLANRIKAPAYFKKEPMFSNTIQDFKAHVQNALNDDKPCIYVLDSLDSLSSSQEIEREYKAAIAKAKKPDEIEKIKTGYQTEKARGINEALRITNGLIEKFNSPLFITQQERANLKTGFGQPEFTTTGGGAPYYYSIHQIWLKKGKTYTDEHLNQKIKIGHKTYAKVMKNKLNGKERECEFDIYNDIGVDDINSCIDYLKSTKKFKQSGKNLIAPQFKFEGVRHELVCKFDDDPIMYKDLQKLIGETWNEVEKAVKIDRKPRFR